jgi:hypothetical protein
VKPRFGLPDGFLLSIVSILGSCHFNEAPLCGGVPFLQKNNGD